MARVYIEEDNSGFWLIVPPVVCCGFLVIASPGIIAVSVVRSVAGGEADIGQMWTFAIISCVAIISGIFAFLNIKNKKLPEDKKGDSGDIFINSCVIYGIISLIVFLTCLIAHFGFHSEFPSQCIRWFFFESVER
jgi:hypothetical protein